jgi:hypothetical protein
MTDLEIDNMAAKIKTLIDGARPEEIEAIRTIGIALDAAVNVMCSQEGSLAFIMLIEASAATLRADYEEWQASL